MRNNPQQRHLLVTAGNENTLKLWTLERATSPIFTAKNVSNNVQQSATVSEIVILLLCLCPEASCLLPVASLVRYQNFEHNILKMKEVDHVTRA